MEEKNYSILDNFLNQFKMIHKGQTDLPPGRDGQDASTSAIMAQPDQPPIGQNNFSGQKNEATLSEERKKQIKFCQLLWEGASEKVTKANSETEANGNKAPDDPAFQQEDMTLRRKILDELQNPNVNFRNFALLVYRWRDMHLNRVMHKKQTLGIPSWQAPSCGARGEDEGAHES